MGTSPAFWVTNSASNVTCQMINGDLQRNQPWVPSFQEGFKPPCPLRVCHFSLANRVQEEWAVGLWKPPWNQRVIPYFSTRCHDFRQRPSKSRNIPVMCLLLLMILFFMIIGRNSGWWCQHNMSLDHGKNNESYSTGPNLVRSVCLKRHVLNSRNIAAARCWRVKWDWDVLVSKQSLKQFG